MPSPTTPLPAQRLHHLCFAHDPRHCSHFVTQFDWLQAWHEGISHLPYTACSLFKVTEQCRLLPVAAAEKVQRLPIKAAAAGTANILAYMHALACRQCPCLRKGFREYPSIQLKRLLYSRSTCGCARGCMRGLQPALLDKNPAGCDAMQSARMTNLSEMSKPI